jgi:replication initiation and membrane attachment protein DnaB
MNEIRDRRDKHWFWIDDAVVDTYHKVLGPFGLALYAVLARHANQHGQCYPSMRRLQMLMGDASRNTIKKYLALLVQCGLIHYTTRTDEDGDATSHLYTLLPMPTTTPLSPVDVPHNEGGVSTIDRGGSTIDGGWVNH